MNKDLYGKEYGIPENQLENLKKFETNERVSNLVKNGKISYSNAKKFKHDMESDSNLKQELGGDMFYNWINQTLGSDRGGIKNTKKSKSLVMNNTFIKPHEKNSLKNMNRPTKSHKKTLEKYDTSITENLKRINEIMKKII